MRRATERVALILPAWMNLTLLAAVITVLLANLTDSWLPWHFAGWLRHVYAGPHAAGSGAFCGFILAVMSLYVLSLSACGMMIAVAVRMTVIKVRRLAAR